MDPRSSRKRPYIAAVWFASCAVLAGLALPSRAHAQFTGSASATGQLESNTNVFALPSGASPYEVSVSRRSDTYLAYGADLIGNYAWDRQQFFATISAKEFEYQHLTDLDHTYYHFDTGLNWQLGDRLYGKLDVNRTRSMVPFVDLTGSMLDLSLDTQQTETAQFGYQLGSKWTVLASASSANTEEPIANEPNLQLTQNSGTTSIRYLGVSGLTSGFTAGYSSGRYSGVTGTYNPSFSQITAAATSTYDIERMTFDGQLGYTRRNSSADSDDTSGFTGLIDVKYQLTPKTRFTVKLDRMINSYLLNSGSEIDTDAGASVDWQTTYKVSMTGGYTFTYRDYPGQNNNPIGTNRIDIQEIVTAAINYQAERWLQIKAYANGQTRRSTFIGAHFSQNIFGVTVTVTPYTLK